MAGSTIRVGIEWNRNPHGAVVGLTLLLPFRGMLGFDGTSQSINRLGRSAESPMQRRDGW